MENQETLKSGTLIGKFSDPVEDLVDDFFTNGVMSTSVVVCRIFLTGDQLLRMEQLPVRATSNLVDNRRFEIHKNSPGYVFSCTGLTEESVEGVVSITNRLVARHLSIGLNAVLEAVQLPACITNLTTCLSNMDRNTLTHFEFVCLLSVTFLCVMYR